MNVEMLRCYSLTTTTVGGPHLGSIDIPKLTLGKLNSHRALLQPLKGFAAEIGAAEVVAFMGKRLPAGSTKYVASLGMIEYLAMHGRLADCKTFVLSSSGNTAIAQAINAAEMGIGVIAVLDVRTASGKVKELQKLGVEIVLIKQPHPTGGFVLARIEKAKEIERTVKGAIDVDQYNNLGASLAHYSFTGRYIWECLKGQIDIVAAAISTGATAGGIFHRIREYSSRVATLAVDCEGSILTGRPAGKHLLTGIGAQIISANMRVAYPAMVGLPPAVVSDADAFNECHRLRQTDDVFVGGSSGAVLAALRKLGKFIRGKRVVAVLADGGESYEDTIFNSVWLEAHGIQMRPF